MSALGPGNGDVAYRMQGLRHTRAETGPDDSVPAGTLLRLWLSAAVPALIIWAAFAFLALFVFAVSEPNAFGDSTPGDEVLAIGSLLSFIVFWLVLLSARVDEPLGEWRTLIEERWQSADSAYAAIYATLRRRGIPVAADAVRVRSDLLPPEVLNNRLVITDHHCQIFISLFPYGSSLYLGWTMSRSRRGAALLGRFLRDLVGGMSGRTGPVERMLRAERARALREAVHAAVREGAEVAAQGVMVAPGPAFGAEVPVRDLRARAESAYPPHPAAAPASAPPVYVAPPAPGPDPYAAPTPTPAPVEVHKPRPHPAPSEGADPPIS